MGDQDDLISGPWLGNEVTARQLHQSGLGTAHCRTICRCDDGCDYAIKDGLQDATIPHSEWFCTKLGEAAGLASPTCKIVNVQGEQWFGSRWETGHDASDWWLRATAGKIDFALLKDTISRIYAFDLFVHNVDRHLTNFIIREQHAGIAMLAFDYSLAWLCNGFPPPDLPMDAGSNTVHSMRYLRQQFGPFVSIREADTVLNNLKAVPLSQIAAIIDSHPKIWLTDSQKTGIMDWWKSTQRLERIEKIREGIKDGTYL